jgi:integration host factor subunit alpha
MSGKTITRADLVEVFREEVDFSRKECAALLESVLDEIANCLIEDAPVKISTFGSFIVRQKGERMGRNPNAGEPYPITPRKVIVFRPSQKLKHWINHPEDKPRRPKRQLELF